jgi:DNA-binding SARP family transcriptional activator
VQPFSIAILGRPEVQTGDTIMAVSGKPAAVLAVLVLNRGSAVSATALIDALWGDDPPPTARSALQVHVAKLRRALPPGAIQTVPAGGYRLSPDEVSLDVDRCGALVAAGRAALAAGVPAEAEYQLAEALSLWRGEPLDGVRLYGLEGEVARIEERRREGEVLHAEAVLALGRHHDALAELEALRSRYPLDERIAAATALARFRSGSAAEALEVLSDLRRDLSRELGIAPGAAVQQLELAILSDDPSLAETLADADEVELEHRQLVTGLVCRPVLEELDVEARRHLLAVAGTGVERIVAPLMPDDVTVRGHGVVVTFGVTAQHEDDVVRAFDAALLLTSALPDLLHVPVAFGLASGEAVVAQAAGSRLLRTTDPIDEAERLAVSVGPDGIALGPVAAELLSGRDVVQNAIAAGTEIRFERSRVVSAEAPLVGRDGELAWLAEAYGRAARGERTLVLVVGDAGVGKSRLVREFLANVQPDAWTVNGRCLPYGRDITLWPIAEVLRSLAEVTSVDSPEEARGKLAALIGTAEDAPYLLEQAAVAIGLEDSSPAPDELRWAVRRCLELAASRGRPVVVTIDDLQFADDGVLDVLGYLAEPRRDLPLLIVALARTGPLGRGAAWVERGTVRSLRVAPLADPDAFALLSAIEGGALIDASVRSRIVATAGGNPLFLGELLRAAIDRGGDDLELPPSVQQVISARLDRLAAVERTVLDAAAIVGEEFSEADVVALRPDLTDAQVRAALAELERDDLITLDRALRGLGRTFRFRHLLVRDATYRGIPKEVRARDHARFADVTVAVAGDRLPEVEEIVGYHLETALGLQRAIGGAPEEIRALGERAADHLGAAARRALWRDDDAVAGRLCGRAIQCLPGGDARRRELWWRKALAFGEVAMIEEAQDAIDHGLAEAADAGDERTRLRLLVEVEFLRWLGPTEAGWITGMHDAAVALIDQLAALGDAAGEMRAVRLLNDSLITLGRCEAAVACATRGLELAEVSGELWDRSIAASWHGPLPVEETVERARRHLAEHQWHRADMYAVLGAGLAFLGREAEAREALEASVTYATEIGGAIRVANVLMMSGYALLYLDALDEAVESFVRSIDLLTSVDEASMRSTSQALLGDAWYRLGARDRAWEATRDAERLSADDDFATAITWRGVRAKILADDGRVEEALRLAHEAVAVADRTDFLMVAAEAHASLAHVLRELGEMDAADVELENARELYRKKGATAGLTLLDRATTA